MNTIARATAEDADAILALQKRAYESEAHLYNDWTIPPMTQTIASLLIEISDSTVLKCEAAGTIVGSVRAMLKGGVCQIGRLIVEPSLQGRGIGSALLAKIESEFPRATTFELFTGTKSDGNLRLYRRFGYKETVIKVLSPHVSLIFMSKHGNSCP